jgi:hypothetical protein
MAVRLSVLCAGSPLPPGRFLVLISVRPEGHSEDGKIRSIEKCNGLMENRTRDLQACRIVPEPTIKPDTGIALPLSFTLYAHLWPYADNSSLKVVTG